MTIKTEQDIVNLEKAINSCRRPVWLVAPDGKQFNLKNTMERYAGIAMLLNDKYGEMEIFTSCREDEIIMMEFYSSQNEAYRMTGIRHIHEACTGACVYAGGYHWRYVEP